MIWVCAFVITLAVLCVRLRRSVAPTIVEVDDVEIRRTVAGKLERVRWDELVRIDIVTTDQGPFVDDVYWLFFGHGGSGCALEGSQIDERIFARLKELPGVDYVAMIQAMGSTENASFHVWSRATPSEASAEPSAEAQP